MVAALNTLFRFLGWEECRVRFLKIQRRLISRCGAGAAAGGLCTFALCGTRARPRAPGNANGNDLCHGNSGFRGALYYNGSRSTRPSPEITLKGKIRMILLPEKLCRKLCQYASKKKITSGEIFLTGGGKSLSRRQIWAEMKRLCRHAGVPPAKVFPHNLRHLFATAFYRVCKDIARLADVLGHSSIETTRIYLLTSGAEHARQLDRLGLIL